MRFDNNYNDNAVGTSHCKWQSCQARTIIMSLCKFPFKLVQSRHLFIKVHLGSDCSVLGLWEYMDTLSLLMMMDDTLIFLWWFGWSVITPDQSYLTYLGWVIEAFNYDIVIDIYDSDHQDLGPNCSFICLWDKRHLLDLWHLLVGFVVIIINHVNHYHFFFFFK